MKRRSILGLAVLVAAAAEACAGGGPPAQPAAPVSAKVASASDDAGSPLVLERTVAGTPTAFHLRAAEFPNLFYQVDCLAGTTRCSRAAYGDACARRTTGSPSWRTCPIS